MSANSNERLGTYICKYSNNIGKKIENTNILVNNFPDFISPSLSKVPTLHQRKVSSPNTPRWTNLSA